MKRIIFFCFVAFPLLTQAQITLVESDFPVPAQSYILSETADIVSTDYQLTGADYTWDMSYLIPQSQDTSLFVDPNTSDIPITYRIAFNNPTDPDHDATVATPADFGAPVPGITFSDVYFFFKLTSSSYTQVGVGVSVNSAPIPALMNPTDQVFQLPVNYLDQDTSYSYIEMTIPTIGFYSEAKTRINEVDGWGTIITPFGTFSALRVKTDLLMHDSLYYDAYSMGFGTDRSSVEYKWYADGFSIPIVQITESTGMGAGSTIVYIDSLRDDVGMRAYPLTEKASIWPNPATDICRIVVPDLMDDEAQLIITDALGKLVSSEQVFFNRSNYIEVNVSSLPDGIYNIQLLTQSRTFVSRLLVTTN